jgi:hypothetical protein
MPPAIATPVPTATTRYCRADIDGVEVFYREAGPKGAPVIRRVLRRLPALSSLEQMK